MIQIGGTRVVMEEQPVNERIKNFRSVPFGYDAEEAIAEAQRCIQCIHSPCEKLCPVHMDIKAMIREIVAGNFKQAFFIAKKDNAIPAITGRVCPQEEQCEGVCPFSLTCNGINIGKLEAFVADWAMNNGVKEGFHSDFLKDLRNQGPHHRHLKSPTALCFYPLPGISVLSYLFEY